MIHIENDRFTLMGALQRYQIAWRNTMTATGITHIMDAGVPTTIGWKVGDKARLFHDLQSIATETEQTHIGTVNGRFIASAVLHKPIDQTIWIVKILERRPGSTDPLGLDSVDFIAKDPQAVYQACKQAGLTTRREHNDLHDWVSVRFGAYDEFEAKFTDHLVLAVAQQELALRERDILSRI